MGAGHLRHELEARTVSADIIYVLPMTRSAHTFETIVNPLGTWGGRGGRSAKSRRTTPFPTHAPGECIAWCLAQ